MTPSAGPIGRFGTAGVGIIAGPGGWQEDLSLSKQFSIREKLRLSLFVLANNVFNHPNLGDPTTDITQPALAGTILSLRGDPNVGVRLIQLGVRIEF